ncbi:transcription termination factor Rho [Nocardioides taihuensis]|uniref:Transcription termination factor Rho n=1 Tax=Nocardioides taihuensis TaxID=1835606 RepID=A0ABW0BMQ9_9ACTN
MTETIDSTATPAGDTPKKRAGGLNSMLIADLKAMANGMGIAGAGSMKKAQLVEAIKGAQAGGRQERSQERPAAEQREQRRDEPRRTREERAPQQQDDKPEQSRKTRDAQQGPQRDQQQGQQRDQKQGQQRDQKQERQQDQRHDQRQDQKAEKAEKSEKSEKSGRTDQASEPRDHQQGQQQKQQAQRDQAQRDQQQRDQQQREDGTSSRNRRRRGRDRDRSRPQRSEPDTTILDDDVLVPAAGILDVLDNYAFVRTSGYLPGPDDVYLSLTMVRKYGLRRGDAIVGQVRQPREGERREKFNPMVRIDAVNGADPETTRERVEFSQLTPLYPTERLRLETAPDNLIGRVIDIAAPIGKGQRGLIVSPAKAGKTIIMQSIANSITTNNPECHLMVVLVDERPEEVTDFERSVKGEVISSTFDRPASDHTMVAELAIERAKRLVELGHDVVVLLDGITRLGRAYNLAAPASGRILSGGVDSAALYPPKKFFGAARNIENGGSLTILATALIESGSKMDEVIFEEFKGTGNMEIRLRRDFADKRLFPAIDAVQSGTRREELLMSKEELAIVWKLRRVLSSLEGQQALELLLERLRKSQTNIEFLMQVQKTTPSPGQGD